MEKRTACPGRISAGGSTLAMTQGVGLTSRRMGDHKGVVLFPNKENDGSASAYRDAEILVTLLGVPDRFAEKLGCGDYFGGEGFLHRTSEQVLWRMWYPCL